MGAVFVSASAFAGTKFLTVDVIPLVPKNSAGLPSVSYSGVKAALGQTLNAAYQANITNTTSSNVSNAWFKIHSSINNGAGPAFVSIPDGCLVDPQVLPLGSGLVCQFSLASVSPPASVSYVFIVPTPNAPNSGQDSSLKLVWSVLAGQGSADSNPSNIVNRDSPEVILSLDSSAGLRSYILHDTGFKVAVGNSNTLVTPSKDVPVDLQQAVDSSSCSAMYKKCFKSTLSIVDPLTNALVTFDTTPLYLDLFRDKSTLKGFADINNIDGTLVYTSGTTTYAIHQCVTTLPGPVFSIGAGDDRCYIPATPVNPYTFVDGSGGWHIRILGKTNGITNW